MPPVPGSGTFQVRLGGPGQSRNGSNLDLLVEFLPEADTDLVEFAGLMQELSSAFGRSVDLISKPGLNPTIRRTVLAEARALYAV